MRASTTSKPLWPWLLAIGLALIIVAWWPELAHAGRTGGSMGGGSFSSGGHYSGGGGGGGYYYGGGGGYGGSSDFDFVFAVIAIVIWIIVWFVRQAGNSGVGRVRFMGNDSYDDGYSPQFIPNSADVTVLRIAVDARARKFVQSELARIARIADTATAQGRATMLREVALMLRRLRDAWVYGGAVNEPMRAEMEQKAVFERYVDDARARFMHETVRNEAGTTTTADAPTFVPLTEQGEGLILVTIVIAAHTELFTVQKIDDGNDLREALESASHRSAEDLIAIEIVWMPSVDEDRLTSIELEAKYPPPDLIKIRGALVGKVFCAYCGGPFPGELVSCPFCGAPAAGATHATTGGTAPK